MSTEIQKKSEISDETMASVILNGDLSKLSDGNKVQYYKMFCERLGLDPAMQPFKLLKLQGKEILYAGREGAQQINRIHKISHTIISREKMDGLYMVVAEASTSDGRKTQSIGAVSLEGLKGEAFANAVMKCESKAKRRATLDLVGIGLLDESEVETIKDAKYTEVPNRAETPKELEPSQLSHPVTVLPEAPKREARSRPKAPDAVPAPIVDGPSMHMLDTIEGAMSTDELLDIFNSNAHLQSKMWFTDSLAKRRKELE